MTNITDEQIIAQIPQSGVLTAYIRGRVCHAYNVKVSTAWVLKQLKRLEKEGKVARCATMYRVQLAWQPR